MKFFQVDSFADALFRGNPAGVCVLQDGWISDSLMQSIAAEVNLSETVFVADIGGCLYLRWFTPTVEVDLCGHATLAAAHVLYHHLGYEGVLSFQSEHHQLSVYQKSDMLILDFPIDKIWQIPTAPDCVNISPIKYWRGTDEYIFVYEKESQIRAAVCDMEKAGKIDLSGIIITAPADDPALDFVSRYFAPKIGIPEDPVTGSAHTLLAPYWRGVLRRDHFRATQLSPRGGILDLQIIGERVHIGGKAITFLVGEIAL